MSRQSNGFDFTRRIDGRINIWAYMPWPDDYLDSNPEALAHYLRSTGGWRVHGWQIVNVVSSFPEAYIWADNHSYRGN